MPRKTSDVCDLPQLHKVASMRPRPDAAENALEGFHQPVEYRRFNEAAARCRGKRTRGCSNSATPLGFNEAAARCRGKLQPLPRGGW